MSDFVMTVNGRTYAYDSEAQVRTVSRLYVIQHPMDEVTVTILGDTYSVTRDGFSLDGSAA